MSMAEKKKPLPVNRTGPVHGPNLAPFVLLIHRVEGNDSGNRGRELLAEYVGKLQEAGYRIGAVNGMRLSSETLMELDSAERGFPA